MAKTSQDLRSPLARVRGLGSAKEGTSHFWWQRITALALVPLSIWFVYSILFLLTLDVPTGQQTVATWFASPLQALAMAILLLALFYHAKLGMQVIIEDYVRKPAYKFPLLLFSNFVLFALAAISILSVLKLHFLGLPPTTGA